ncbi:MAG TPA: radical SAM protein [Anaerolineae bacterium]|nr:radical SAM protein [Anaerolineae bacterium]
MTIELRPLGVLCNLQCRYCYQHPQRDSGAALPAYDLEKMKAAAERAGGHFSLFGGEALLVPEADLEDLWHWGLQKFGQNGVQTNGTLITENHIRMFKQYRVHVGISLDGPDELNDVRWAGSLERTRAATAHSQAMVERLLRENVNVSLITTLYRGNATQEQLPRLHAWFRDLDRLGLKSARLHIMEAESDEIRAQYALADEENVVAFLSFAYLEPELRTLRLDIFKDMRNMLLGKDNCVTCVWTGCDSYTTRAVQGIEFNGQVSNCGRTTKDGVDFIKADVSGHERYLALYQTPQAYGGCQGCRFFLMCKGNCPGTALQGDWRNRSEYCTVWKQLYRHLEEELLDQGQIPITAHPQRQQIEQALLDAWAHGTNLYMANVLSQLQAATSPTTGKVHGGARSDRHGDHTDMHRAETPHGDIPHGDKAHGDHTDTTRA